MRVSCFLSVSKAGPLVEASERWKWFELVSEYLNIWRDGHCVRMESGAQRQEVASMPYPEEWVKPAREELNRVGVRELKTSAEVDAALSKKEGTVLVVVNSICGCAAGSARPAIIAAINEEPRPKEVVSVFAGQDVEATERAREYFRPQPPSSPSVALMRDGRLVYMMHRHQIEGRPSDAISADLKEAFREYCSDR